MRYFIVKSFPMHIEEIINFSDELYWDDIIRFQRDIPEEDLIANIDNFQLKHLKDNHAIGNHTFHHLIGLNVLTQKRQSLLFLCMRVQKYKEN